MLRIDYSEIDIWLKLKCFPHVSPGAIVNGIHADVFVPHPSPGLAWLGIFFLTQLEQYRRLLSLSRLFFPSPLSLPRFFPRKKRV